MKPQLQIHVPQPCHEDWNKMTPTDKGKFCGSCNKQVVDFSLMSDQQVLNYFSTATGKTCGRFAEDQLQRELIPTKIEKKKIWWFAALMPLLLFFDKATAQKKNITTPGTPALIKKDPIPQIMGKVAAPVIKDNAILVGEVVENKQCTPLLVDTVLMPVHESFVKDDDRLPINGKILDEQGNIIPFATISIKEPTISFSADGEGFFKTRINNPYRSIAITASSVGYETREVEINAEEANNISITLKQKEIKLPDVIVVSDNFLTGRLGGAVCIVTKITKRDLRDTIIRKVFRNEAFKVYPNPVTKGGQTKIEIKKAGEYSIQLLDNASKLLLVNEFVAESDYAVTPVNIPSILAAGIYYIRVIDERKKKSYVDKIVIQ